MLNCRPGGQLCLPSGFHWRRLFLWRNHSTGKQIFCLFNPFHPSPLLLHPLSFVPCLMVSIINSNIRGSVRLERFPFWTGLCYHDVDFLWQVLYHYSQVKIFLKLSFCLFFQVVKETQSATEFYKVSRFSKGNIIFRIILYSEWPVIRRS